MDKIQKWIAVRLFRTQNDVMQSENQLNTLFEKAKSGDQFSKDLLGYFSFYSNMHSMKYYSLQLLLKTLSPNDVEFAPYFSRNLIPNDTYRDCLEKYLNASKNVSSSTQLTKYFETLLSIEKAISSLSLERMQNFPAEIKLFSNLSGVQQRDLTTIQQSPLFSSSDAVSIKMTLLFLSDAAKKGDTVAKFVLGDYSFFGALPSMQVYALELLNEIVSFGDRSFLGYFESNINKMLFTYFQKAENFLADAQRKPFDKDLSNIFIEITELNRRLIDVSFEGYLKILAAEAYPFFVEFIADLNQPFVLRGKAIKKLAEHSKYPFDEDIKYGTWTESRFRVKEIKEWGERGFPEFVEKKKHIPIMDKKLKKPESPLEIVCQSLHKKALKDKSYLEVADKEEMNKIISFWNLPLLYREFLERFSPAEGTSFSLNRKNLVIELYGASSLIQGNGFFAFRSSSWDGITRIPEWPENSLVIARECDLGDVFVMNLAESSGNDAPIYYMMHDDREKLIKVSDSFLDFLNSISLGKLKLD